MTQYRKQLQHVKYSTVTRQINIYYCNSRILIQLTLYIIIRIDYLVLISYLFQKLCQVLVSIGRIVLDPRYHGIKHTLLRRHIQIICGENLQNLLERQFKKFFRTNNFSEILSREFVCNFFKLETREHISKRSDSETIGHSQMSSHELRASICDWSHLQHTRSCKYLLDVTCRKCDFRCVEIVHE